MEIITDACAIMAVIVKEPERDLVIQLTQNAVIVNNKDGMKYKILPIKDLDKKGKSPFEDIPYITADITTQEIVGLIRESRVGI